MISSCRASTTSSTGAPGTPDRGQSAGRPPARAGSTGCADVLVGIRSGAVSKSEVEADLDADLGGGRPDPERSGVVREVLEQLVLLVTQVAAVSGDEQPVAGG